MDHSPFRLCLSGVMLQISRCEGCGAPHVHTGLENVSPKPRELCVCACVCVCVRERDRKRVYTVLKNV